MLKSAGGASIIVNDFGIYIENGKGAGIVLAGSPLRSIMEQSSFDC